jgi:CubicO group peptidase (beta-lactamase class C family)
MKTLTLLLSLSLWTSSAIAGDDFSAIDKYVNAAKKEVGLPSGTAIAIVKNGKVVYEGYFGYANIKEKKKVTDKTAFYIASITKPIFALSTLLMEHKGDIKDTMSMTEMFPELKFSHIDTEQIQLKNLMSHTAGISNWPFVASLAYTGNHDSAQRHKLVAASTYDEKNKLGEFQYTNLGYNIVSVWAEDYYKQDWQKTISELIYEPLAMVRTSSYMSDSIKKSFEVARPYGLRGKDPREVLAFEKSNITMHGAGGTISTASDMARFLIAHLNEGRVDGNVIFPAEVILKSHQQLAVNDLRYRDFIRKGYAWGWYIGPYEDEEMYHHFGGVAGTHTHTSFMLKHNIGLVILNNESSISSKLSNGIADIAYSILLNKGSADDISDMHILQMKEAWSEIKPKLQMSIDNSAKRDLARTMILSHTRSKYAGIFHNSLWGDLKVELLDSGRFEFTLGEIHAVATAYTKPDTMRVEFPVMGGGKVVTYKIKDGEVKELDFFGERFNKL